MCVFCCVQATKLLTVGFVHPAVNTVDLIIADHALIDENVERRSCVALTTRGQTPKRLVLALATPARALLIFRDPEWSLCGRGLGQVNAVVVVLDLVKQVLEVTGEHLDEQLVAEAQRWVMP